MSILLLIIIIILLYCLCSILYQSYRVKNQENYDMIYWVNDDGFWDYVTYYPYKFWSYLYDWWYPYGLNYYEYPTTYYSPGIISGRRGYKRIPLKHRRSNIHIPRPPMRSSKTFRSRSPIKSRSVHSRVPRRQYGKRR